ncbi:MAG TPA: hypothetical protein VHF70_03120 [Rubrobacteraceae bacterium]|nr:hypothetical protein [Rubrobacteraceae bacterium]
MVDLSGLGLLVVLLGKLYATTATIAGWRQLPTLGYKGRTRRFTRKDWE